jgi:hypothetical protein
MNRREEPCDLSKGAELKHGVIERGLTLQQDTAQLDDHAEAECQRDGDRTHLCGGYRLSVDDDFCLPTGQPRNLRGLLETGGGSNPRQRRRGGDQREPDPFTLESAHQGHPAPLEQLPVCSGEPARGCEGTRKGC